MVLTSNVTHPPTKEAYVYGILREAILNCDLKPGEKLVIDRLSEEMGMSPIPIRTAIQRLEAEGLVIIKPHAGATVAPVSPESITELFTLAAALESIVVRLLAPKITSAELDKMRVIVRAMDQAAAKLEGQTWLRLDYEFHISMAQFSDAALLADFTQKTHETWLRLCQCVFVKTGPLRMEEAQREHQRMVSLLEERDAPTLEDLIVKHYRLSLQAYQGAFRDDSSGRTSGG